MKDDDLDTRSDGNNEDDDDDGDVLLEAFLDRLRSQDYDAQLDCLNHLTSVALAIGFSNFRTKLLPKLTGVLKYDDSLLAVLAETLGDMVAYVGGVDHVSCLLEPLEKLASNENNEIRVRAISSLNKLMRYHTQKELESLYMPMFRRFLASQSIVAKLSACQMVLKLYERSTGSMKKEMRSLIGKMTLCSNPIVREEVTKVIVEMIPIVPLEIFVRELFPLFLALVKDQQESVKKVVISNILPLFVKLPTAYRESYIFSIVEKAAADISDDVRSILANNLPALTTTVFEVKSRKTMMSIYQKMFSDCNLTVKSTAILKLPNFLEQLMSDEKEETVENFVMPCLKDLINEESISVRLSLATVIGNISSHVSDELVVNDIFPIIKKISKDGNQSVREELMNQLFHINKTENIEAIFENLLPSLTVLVTDIKWKVRLASLRYNADLALKAGHDTFFAKQHTFFISWLTDSVAIIRETCVDHLVLLFKKYGYQMQMSFFPVVLQQTRNQHYLVRIACLQLIRKLAPIYVKETILETVLPLLNKLSNDPIANVRLNVAIAIMHLSPNVENNKLLELNVVPPLEKLVDDKDDDVRFFAEDALEGIFSLSIFFELGTFGSKIFFCLLIVETQRI
ncbi:hypothetical protein HELRODRAFT_64110 [Helobdella robusta]|uniref:Phosphatase 2A Regulatory Subunit A helical domain-containing protein n=1 Tax=Helobdella robusta TaxID=6412 RepID=T1FXP4_HELRO|nr:hypothetical protein HELRODRAFT_64110 [Helobdella robusta]ESO06248.1 hypothetical protein HELRODRAFT_64110 [Helobdella robusta]